MSDDSRKPNANRDFEAGSHDLPLAIQLPDDVSVVLDAQAVCALSLNGPLLPETVTAIRRSLVAYRTRGGLLCGLLVDMQRCGTVSIVRLSALLDAVAVLCVPIAVLLSDEQQMRLAHVMHNTLSGRDFIAYFTDQHAAQIFLNSVPW